MVAAKDVPRAMVRLCEKAPTLEVRDKCLSLVEEWAANLRREPAFAEAFHALQRAGYRFPNPRHGVDGSTSEVPAPVAVESFNGRGDWSARTDISEADRNAIAAALAEEEEEVRAAAAAEEEARAVVRARVAAANEERRGIYPSHIATGIPVNAPPRLDGADAFDRALRESERTAAEDVARRRRASSSTSSTARAVAHTPQDVAKLKADVGVARNSLQIFSRTLDETDLSQPATKNGLDGGVASDLAGQCRAMQPRLIELISNAHDEELLASAIELNEALTKEIERFDLMTRACSGDAEAFARVRGGTRSTKPTTTTESLLSQLDEGLRVASSPPASTGNPFDQPASTSNPFDHPASTGNPFNHPASTPPGGPPVSPPQPIPTPTTTTMRVNPIFDGIYAPDASSPHAHRSLPLGSSAMNGVASASPAGSPAAAPRGDHHRRSPISDPFADLSAAAAVRVARSPRASPGGPGIDRSGLPDI